MKDIIAPIDSDDGLFHDGDPAGDVRGTVLYAQWLNAMQGAVIDTQTEQKNILAAAGMQPNPAQNNQLAEAIKGLIAQAQQTSEKHSLLRKNNGADIPDKAAFVAHLGLKNTVEQAQNALDKRTGGTVIAKKLNYGYTDFMSYSIDFRRRILSIKKHEGLSIRETAKRFHIGTTTIVRWTKQIDARPATSRQRKIDKSALERDVEQYPDAYQRERAERFGVCQMAICKALKKLQLTYKKNSASSKSRRRR